MATLETEETGCCSDRGGCYVKYHIFICITEAKLLFFKLTSVPKSFFLMVTICSWMPSLNTCDTKKIYDKYTVKGLTSGIHLQQL